MRPKKADRILSILLDNSESILKRLFTPGSLIKSGSAINANTSLREQFEHASSLYFIGNFTEALQAFDSLGAALDTNQIALRRIAAWNAATCAIMVGDNDRVVELLSPMYATGSLYGTPLWNLAIAYYRLGRKENALRAMKDWVARDVAGNKFRFAKGELIVACLSVLTKDEDAAQAHLQKAAQQSASLVGSQLGLDQEDLAAIISGTSRQVPFRKVTPTVSPAVRGQLIQIAEPKRPERNPALSAHLTYDEMERYTRALEILAEGNYEQAAHELNQLRDKYPNVSLLGASAAAALLFAGRNETARDILLQLEQLGAQLTGATLWNLACAQIRLGDWSGALRALRACAETEYRSKPQIWDALRALGADLAPMGQPSAATKSLMPVPALPLAHNLPKAVNECRIEVLRRIIRPKKIPKSMYPELTRLPQREREKVADILSSAHKTTSADGVGMLLPLVDQYPELYTLKAHAAAHLILNGESSRARSLLRQAQSIHHLDAISRYNLAYTYLQDNKIENVATLLEEGTVSSLAGEYTYWLSVASVRAITGYGKPDDAAARAVALVSGRPTEAIVKEVLRAAGIRAAPSITTENPSVIVARTALARIKEGDVEGGVRALAEARVNAEQIPEIGRHVLEPQFRGRPGRTWENEIIKSFTSATRQYRDEQFGQAAASFASLYQEAAIPSIAVNLTAAYLKAGEPKRAVEKARTALQRYQRYKEWSWRLAYNLSLAYTRLGAINKAMQTVQRHRRPTALERLASPRSSFGVEISISPRRLTALLIALCSSEDAPVETLEDMASALDELRQSVYSPSDDLMLTLAWAKLIQTTPDIEGAQTALRDLAQRKEGGPQPPAEVRAMHQVRAAYEHLTSAGEINKAVDYMTTVIETKSRERQTAVPRGVSSRDLEQNVGVELVARVCLVRAYSTLDESERAIRELDETETMVKENAPLLAQGLLMRDWFELAQAAETLSLPWAAMRYCEQGLKIEPENGGLCQLKEKLAAATPPEKEAQLLGMMLELQSHIDKDKNQAMQTAEKLRAFAPVLTKVLNELLDQIDRDEDVDIEELCDRVGILARMQLPDQAYVEIESLLAWFIRTKGREESRIPVDIDVHDEKIWPKADDEREGSCLLTLTSRHDIDRLTVTDPMSERRIWEGSLKAGKTEYARWTVYREDGFAPGAYLDLPLLLRMDNQSGQTTVRTFVNVLVGSSEPIWPTYPTGALAPDDVAGEELYGRLQLIRTITRSLGRKRSQATFFLQAPRQMGKTSLLYFVKRRAPDHVLPVYINLEKEWSKHEPSNLWNYLVQLVLETGSRETMVQPRQSLGEADLIKGVASICDRQNRDYVLLLLDEVHCLFDRSKNANAILASFRDFLNNRDNRIALLLSDRYTRDELEQRCPSEYWAQLSVLAVGPLDQPSTKQAIEFPTRGTDVAFLPETIERLYHRAGGYPYHVQRIAQYALESMYSGPWLTALPGDVDEVVPRMLEQDILFQAGLCRPDRIDAELAEAIAALLEWRDLCDFLPDLLAEAAEAGLTPSRWLPIARAFLAHMKNPDQIIGRLKDIGVMREDGEAFFSPLLELWLKKTRREARGLSGEKGTATWQVISAIDGSTLAARDWQNLDSELVRRAKYRAKPPLKEKTTRADDWETMVREVRSESDFGAFLDAVFRLVIDARDEKGTMIEYPWLFLAYHRTRLVRNFVVHRSNTKPALTAWNAVCTRALGGERSAYWPSAADEWRAFQVALLRTLYAGMHNAIEIAGQPS